MQEFIKLNTEPSDVIRLFPDLFPKDPISKQLNQSALAKLNVPTLDGKDLELGLLALAEYLTEVRFNLMRQMHQQKTPNDKTLIDLSIIDTTLLKCYLQVSSRANQKIRSIWVTHDYEKEHKRILMEMCFLHSCRRTTHWLRPSSGATTATWSSRRKLCGNIRSSAS